MLQIENEYGSYGNDKAYLRHVRQICLDNGIDVPLFTSDGPDDWMLQGGTIPECFQTVNFGQPFRRSVRPEPQIPAGRAGFLHGVLERLVRPLGRRAPHPGAADDVAQELDAMLKTGASVNFFVFCGGTNFGFTAGANGNGDRPGDYAPTVTSYDYDGPLTEWGDPTPKFFACQEVIRKYRPDAPFGTPSPVRKAAYGKAELTESAPLLEALDRLAAKHESVRPPTMEACGQNFGFIHYRTKLSGPFDNRLYFPEVRDRSGPGRTGAISDRLPQRRRPFPAGQNRAGGSGARSARREHRTHQLRTARRAGLQGTAARRRHNLADAEQLRSVEP